MKLNFENLSLNTVLIFGAVIGVIYIGWKAKNAIANIDVNPFDEGSFLPSLTDDIGDNIEALIISAGSDPYKAAAANQGIDLSKYKLWVGGRGAVRPSNAVYIIAGRTGSWFVPK